MDAVRTVVLVATTITTGLMAGVFGLYANTIMRGLRATDDRTFVGAFQAMDRAIINPLFLATFFGPLLLGAVAVATLIGDDEWPWVLVATVLYLAVVIITLAINVPMNNGIKAAGDPDTIADLAAVRATFNESRWVAWNLVRTIATTVAFVCLTWALVVHG